MLAQKHRPHGVTACIDRSSVMRSLPVTDNHFAVKARESKYRP